MSVAGEGFTDSRLKGLVECAFVRSALENGRKPGKVDPRQANGFARSSFPRYVADFTVLQAARKSGVRVEPVDVTNALMRLNRLCKKAHASISQYEPEVGMRYHEFKGFFDEDCLVFAYLRQEEGLEPPTDEDIDAYYIYFNQTDEAYAKIDREKWAKAREAYAKLKVGTPWESVVGAYSEDKTINREEFGGDWGAWRAGDFPFGWMNNLVPTMSEGEFTEPKETEAGIVIVRLMGKNEGRYHLGRILLRLTEREPRPNRAAVAAELLESRFTGCMRSALSALKGRFELSYPQGTNFTHEVYTVPAKARKNGEKRK